MKNLVGRTILTSILLTLWLPSPLTHADSAEDSLRKRRETVTRLKVELSRLCTQDSQNSLGLLPYARSTPRIDNSTTPKQGSK